jgi:DNA-binding NarL/FixJ family response regulator
VGKLRVFLADDHLVVREGMKALVNAESDMEIIGEASDGREALHQATTLRPDVAILDLSMPGLTGVQVAQQLKPACPDTKILALTVQEDRSYLCELMGVGVSGYVLKRAAAEELIAAIRTVAAGGVYLDPVMAVKVVSPPPSPPVPMMDLSDRERDVLQLIAQGYTNKEVGAQLNISIKTVETYKTRSMEKLSLRSRVDIVRYAFKAGWLQPH